MENILENDVYKHLHCSDVSLITDIIRMNKNCHDIKAINIRIGVAEKSVKKNLSSVPSTGNLLNYLQCLVQCLWTVVENTKLYRSLLKILEIFQPSHKQELDKLWENTIFSGLNENLTSNYLIKLSILLEQNRTVQEVIISHYQAFFIFVSTQLKFLSEKNPMELSKVEAELIYGYVKISLQIFQTFPDIIQSEIWQDTDASRSDDSCKKIIVSLLSILQKQGHAKDCMLLAGTSLAMFLCTAPTERHAVSAFWSYMKALNFQSNHLDLYRKPSEVIKRLEELTEALTIDESCKLPVLGQIALTRGVTICLSEEVLLCDCGMPFIIEIFHLILHFCKTSVQYHYLSFQLLSGWFKRTVKCFHKLNQLSAYNKSCTSDFLERSLNLLQLNWDSPVEGVSDFVIDTFELIMKIWEAGRRGEACGLTDRLPSDLIERYLHVEWYIKGKYKFIAVLLNYLQVSQVLECCPKMKTQLFRCIATNYLSPSACETYKSILHVFRKEYPDDSQSITLWSTVFLDVFLDGIFSTDGIQRNNILKTWLPWTVKILPNSYEYLKMYFLNKQASSTSPSEYLQYLHVVISVMHWKRCDSVLVLTNEDKQLLEEALCSADDDLRLEAFCCISDTLKKAEPLSRLEVDLLRDALPLSLKTDSAPLRQNLCTCLRKVFVRVRDSCIAMLKSTIQKSDIDYGVKFVDWFYRKCIENLFPSACYQRRKTCLDFLHTLCLTIIYIPEASSKKGIVPESATLLFQYAQQNGLWNFFSWQNVTTLLYCILDGADDIQSSSLDFLSKYFIWPLNLSEGNTHLSEETVACHLLNQALMLCDSPKAYESQSGGHLCQLIYHKYCLNLRWECHAENSNQIVSLRKTTDGNSVSFLEYLLTEVKMSIGIAETETLQAAKYHPIHGRVNTLTRCLIHCMHQKSSRVELGELLDQLIDCNIKITEIILSVLSGGQTSKSCPSFADIGMALDCIVSENQDEDIDTTTLSPDFQFLLSWCWINIKNCWMRVSELSPSVLHNAKHQPRGMEYCGYESSNSLAQLVAGMIEDNRSISIDMVEKIGQNYLNVFTKCRHRGAVEGCRNGFLKFCVALLSSTNNNMNKLPDCILTKILRNLREKGLSTNITRRSAGFPIVIQVICTAERKLKRDFLLQKATENLMQISNQRITELEDQKTDLAQVHALNILKVLFGDSCLVSALMQYVSNSLILVVELFESPSWAVRNAATQLFSTIVMRLFGQKRGKDETHKWNTSLQEFFSLYPDLPAIMLQKLEKATDDINKIDQLHPSLFPVLTLLANLHSVSSHSDSLSSVVMKLKEKVLILTQSPVYQLRQLASNSYTSFVGREEIFTITKYFLQELTEHLSTGILHNFVHGRLLLIEKILNNSSLRKNRRYCKGTYCRKMDQTVISEHHARQWLKFDVDKNGNASFLKCQYCRKQETTELAEKLEVCYQLLKNTNCCLISELCLKIYRKLLNESLVKEHDIIKGTDESILSSVHSASVDMEIGRELFIKEYLQLEISSTSSSFKTKIAVLMRFLKSSLTWVRSVALLIVEECLKEKMREFSKFLEQGSDEPKIVEHLLDLFFLETYPPNKVILQRILVKLYANTCNNFLPKIQEDVILFCCNELRKDEVNFRCLPAFAALLQSYLETHSAVNDQYLICLCDAILQASQTTRNENGRKAAAEAVNGSGSVCLNRCSKYENLSNHSLDLLEATMNLLEDEDSEIRQLVCPFVCHLIKKEENLNCQTLQTARCYIMFYQYISTELWSIDGCLSRLFDMLYVPGQCSEILNKLVIGNACLDHLFDQEDNSFYAEKLQKAILLHETLQICVQKKQKQNSSVDFTSLNVTQLSDDCKYVIDTLTENIIDKPVFNISGNNAVVPALAALCFALDILCTFNLIKHEDANNQLKQNVQTIIKIPNLHPSISHIVREKCTASAVIH